jgi:hypothetical protein
LVVVTILLFAMGLAQPEPTQAARRPIGIPDVVFDAYVKAAEKAPERFGGCRVRWSVLAGIGRVESGHGTTRGAVADSAGNVGPPILGIPLDGRRGTARIADTDGGRWDQDSTWDRALGPMQFIPSTWRSSGVDGNGDGVADPHNIYDATLAAAGYLCRAVRGGDLNDPALLRRAIFSYNHSHAYVNTVLRGADFYDGYELVDGNVAPAAGVYALPLDRAIVASNPTVLSRPHHDYPAIDIGLPEGTPIYAVASGKVISVTSSGKCGNGVVIDDTEGYRYTYCHATSVHVPKGTTVGAGQLIMSSGNTGNSTGPHLHFQIQRRSDGSLLCPQSLLRAWYAGETPSPASAATSGCSY